MSTRQKIVITALFSVLMLAAHAFAEPVIKSKAIKGDLPMDPMSKAWDDATSTVVELAAQNMVTPGITDATVSSVKVKSMHNDKEIAFRVEWYDPSRDESANMPDRFSDACAIQLPVKAGTVPSFMMGDAENPAQIVLWKAAWEKDVAMGHQDVEHAYPNYKYDMYPMVGNDVRKPVSQFSEEARKFMPGIATKNPVSDIDRKVSVEELNAIGFGSLTTQAGQNAKGKGVWDYAHWKVVITKPLNSGDAGDAVLAPGESSLVAVAVWDGDKQNRGGRKNYSSGGWVNLEIEK